MLCTQCAARQSVERLSVKRRLSYGLALRFAVGSRHAAHTPLLLRDEDAFKRFSFRQERRALSTASASVCRRPMAMPSSAPIMRVLRTGLRTPFALSAAIRFPFTSLTPQATNQTSTTRSHSIHSHCRRSECQCSSSGRAANIISMNAVQIASELLDVEFECDVSSARGSNVRQVNEI